jgi:hypothetical protein
MFKDFVARLLVTCVSAWKGIKWELWLSKLPCGRFSLQYFSFSLPLILLCTSSSPEIAVYANLSHSTKAQSIAVLLHHVTCSLSVSHSQICDSLCVASWKYIWNSWHTTTRSSSRCALSSHVTVVLYSRYFPHWVSGEPPPPPHLRLQVSDCTSFFILCYVLSMAFLFCTECNEYFFGIASRYLVYLHFPWPQLSLMWQGILWSIFVEFPSLDFCMLISFRFLLCYISIQWYFYICQ